MSAPEPETTDPAADGPVVGPGWKIAVAVRSDLAPWQKLNVVAFITSGLGTVCPGLIGEPYIDGSERRYPALLARPVRVFTGDGAAIRRGFDRAIGRGLTVSVYTDEMFETMNDADNRSVVAAVGTAELSLAGFAVAGDGKQVDKAFDKLRLHE